VSTIAGNGSPNTYAGTLAETTLFPRFLTVDNENNIFVTFAGYDADGMMRINEEENEATILCSATGGQIWAFQPPGADPVTGIIVANDNATQTMYYYIDPKAGWAPKTKLFKWKDGSTNLPVNPWKSQIAISKLDGYGYFRYYDGQIARVNLETNIGEVLLKTEQGDAWGIAFHPLHPNLLYIAFMWTAGSYANSIWIYDTVDGSLTKYAGSTAAGHRDGPVEQAMFASPNGIQFDQDGNLYVADTNNLCVRRITPEGVVETVLGIPGILGFKDGNKEEALFSDITGIGVGTDGSIYVADRSNRRVRKLAIE
jgi:hypothetical protein